MLASVLGLLIGLVPGPGQLNDLMFTGADDWGGDTMAWVSVVTGRQGEAGRPGSGGAGPGGVRARA